MPLWPEYAEKLKSPYADACNIGKGRAGACNAAALLHMFAEDTPWAHLDIAGTADLEDKKPGHPAGATGVGVALTLELLRKYKAL